MLEVRADDSDGERCGGGGKGSRARDGVRFRSGVGSQVLNVRFANHPEELGTAEWAVRPLVLAHNETTIETPERHEFRYVMVFGGREVGVTVVN